MDCIGQLLACSERELTREKEVCVNNWDEVRSWKSVSPMGVYKKATKKNNIQVRHFCNFVVMINVLDFRIPRTQCIFMCIKFYYYYTLIFY